MAAVELFGTIKGERAKLPNVLILLTDGKQNSDPRATPLEDAVLPLFQLGVKVFAIGVGDQVSRDELRLIVEKDQDIFTVNDFDDLLAKSHQIARATCDEVKATERKWKLVVASLLKFKKKTNLFRLFKSMMADQSKCRTILGTKVCLFLITQRVFD